MTFTKRNVVWCDPIKLHAVSALGANFRTEPRRSKDTEKWVLKQGVKVCVQRIESFQGYEKSWAYVKLNTGDAGWVSSENITFSPY